METQSLDHSDVHGGQQASEDLWLVLAIIQPFKLDSVTLALEAIQGFGGMTVSDCRGFGREKVEEGSPASVADFTDKVKLEVVVAGKEHANAIVDIIARAAHTGNRGDGKVFTWPIARAVRVRTFDEGAPALSRRKQDRM